MVEVTDPSSAEILPFEDPVVCIEVSKLSTVLWVTYLTGDK